MFLCRVWWDFTTSYFRPTFVLHCLNDINHRAGYNSVDYSPETGWKDLDEKRVIIPGIENEWWLSTGPHFIFSLAHTEPWKIRQLTHPNPSAKLAFSPPYLEQNVQSGHFCPKSLEAVGWIWTIFGSGYKCCKTLSRFWRHLSKLSHIWPGIWPTVWDVAQMRQIKRVGVMVHLLVWIYFHS